MRLLEGEVKAGKKRENGLLTAENYDVKSMAGEMYNGRPCAVFELIPLKKTKHTIEGRAWVDPTESAVMRIEDLTAKSASFWVGRPYVIQEFRKVGDSGSPRDISLLPT
jgi:hypothetical protein